MSLISLNGGAVDISNSTFNISDSSIIITQNYGIIGATTDISCMFTITNSSIGINSFDPNPGSGSGSGSGTGSGADLGSNNTWTGTNTFTGNTNLNSNVYLNNLQASTTDLSCVSYNPTTKQIRYTSLPNNLPTNNVWTGKNQFNGDVSLNAITSLTSDVYATALASTPSDTNCVSFNPSTKKLGYTAIPALLPSNNTWTGKNQFNSDVSLNSTTSLTSDIYATALSSTPSDTNCVSFNPSTKKLGYTAIPALLPSNNAWTGTNTFTNDVSLNSNVYAGALASTPSDTNCVSFNPSTKKLGYTAIPSLLPSNNVWTGKNQFSGDVSLNGLTTDITSGYLYSKNLLLQGDGTNAYIKPTNASSSLNLGSSNNNVMTINSTGKVGIGMTNPLNTLDVTGTIGASSTIYSNNLLLQGDGTNAYIRPVNNPSSLYLGSSNNNVMTINSAGNVGIGTTSQAYNLDVSGTANFSGMVPSLMYITSKSYTFNPTANSTEELMKSNAQFIGKISNGAVITIYFDDNGYDHGGGCVAEILTRWGVSPTIRASSSQANYIFYYIVNTYSTYLWFNENRTSAGQQITHNCRIYCSNPLGFNLTTTDGLSPVNSTMLSNGMMMYNGNVGIGMTNPLNTLDVSGTIGASSNIYTNGSIGIGVPIPNGQLQFSNTIDNNRKIVLWDTLNNQHQFYGFGLNSNVLRYQVDGESSSHVFYSGFSDGITTTSKELMRIKGDGNVGIGKASPAYNLDVSGNASVSSFSYLNGATRLNNNNTPLTIKVGNTSYLSSEFVDHGLQLYTGTSSSDGTIYMGCDLTNGINYIQSVKPGTYQKLGLNAKGGDVFMNGNVGIGTPTPTNTLDILGGLTITNNYSLGFGTGTQTIYLNNNNLSGFGSGQTLSSKIKLLGGGQGGSIVGYNTYGSDQGLIFNTSGSDIERMRIMGNGNVGIGTTSPAYKLDVSGGIIRTNTFPLMLGTATDTNNVRMINALDSTTANATSRWICWGKEASTNNSAELQYYHSSNGSTDNYMSLGFYANPALYVKASGSVGIGTTSPDYPLVISRFYNNGGTHAEETASSILLAASGAYGVGIRLRVPANSTVNQSDLQFTTSSNSSNEQLVRMTILGSSNVGGGYVGIGTTSPIASLHIVGNGNNTSSGQNAPLSLTNSSASGYRWDVGPNTGGDLVIFYNNAGAWLSRLNPASGWNLQSDLRLKDDIEPIANCLDKINALRPVNYRWKSNMDLSNKSVGLIAQEVKDVIPEVVNTIYDATLGEIYGINYTSCIPFLIGAVKELSSTVTTLKSKNASLEQQNLSFQSQTLSLQSEIMILQNQNASLQSQTASLQSQIQSQTAETASLKQQIADILARLGMN